MEKSYDFFLGCDTSKAKLNFALADAKGEIVCEFEVRNQFKHICAALNKLLRTHHIPTQSLLLCVESTGIYNAWLLKAVTLLGIDAWVEHPLKIRKTNEPMRGKNDSLDARRIARYAWRYVDEARLYRQRQSHIHSLTRLLRLRQKLVQERTRHKNRLRAINQFGGEEIEKQVLGRLVQNLDEEIQNIEQAMQQIIQTNKQLKERFKLLMSIPGVGFLTACMFIVYTNDFEDFDDPRKFACHAGAAPFVFASGQYTSKAATSQRAQKEVKGILSQAAIAAAKSNSRLGRYYQRKLAEGKAEALVLNNMRNKIIHIAFAIIRTGKMYNDNYVPPAFAA